MKSKDQRFVFGALKKRYEFDSINEKLIEELDWLKSVQSLLLEEVSSRKGKVSGFVLESLTKHYLNGVIEKLEKKRSQV